MCARSCALEHECISDLSLQRSLIMENKTYTKASSFYFHFMVITYPSYDILMLK